MFIISNDHLPTVIGVRPDNSWYCFSSYSDVAAAHTAADGFNNINMCGNTFYVSAMSTTDLLSYTSNELPPAA